MLSNRQRRGSKIIVIRRPEGVMLYRYSPTSHPTSSYILLRIPLLLFLLIIFKYNHDATLFYLNIFLKVTASPSKGLTTIILFIRIIQFHFFAL